MKLSDVKGDVIFSVEKERFSVLIPNGCVLELEICEDKAEIKEMIGVEYSGILFEGGFYMSFSIGEDAWRV